MLQGKIDGQITGVQDKVLGAMRTSQEATVNVCRTWAQTFASVTPSVFEVLSPPKTDYYTGFAQRLWDSQRDFVLDMFEVAADLGRAVPESAKRAAAAAETARPTTAKT